VSRLYGYQRLDTPAFEDASLFNRSVGQGTDIVEKEMYLFQDRAGNSLALRPEGTAPVCRAYLEHGMQNRPQPVKLYYIAPVFRYERPQAGRYRQHHQFGFEAIGDDDPTLDAEVIDMAWHFFLSLGLLKLKLKLNSIGCHTCRPQYLSILRSHYLKQPPVLCRDCQSRLKNNPLRLLDCKKASCQPVASGAPRSSDYLCPDCQVHFEQLQKYLSLLGIPFTLDHRLVRGLDYYTRTVFEIQPEVAGGQSTIGGGGRYDDLIRQLGGRPTPALGFATGLERIVLNLKKQRAPVPPEPGAPVFIADTGGQAKEAAIRLAATLRRDGIGVITASAGKSLKAQLRQANNLSARFSLIIGENELETGTVTLRDMASSKQSSTAQCDLTAFLHSQLH
jgi:histidyl-tRNA synthetase